MGTLLSLSVSAAIVMSCCYAVYKLFIAYKKQYSLNRCVIFAIWVISFVLPLIAAELPVAMNSAGTSLSDAMTTAALIHDYDETAAATGIISSGRNALYDTMLWIYIAGIFITAMSTLTGLFRIRSVIKHGQRIDRGDYTLVIVDNDDLSPFSWHRFIVMNRRDYESDYKPILIHERKHIQQHHWADMIAARTIIALQWFNPAAWLLMKELKVIHEYQADDAVAHSGVDIMKYQFMLINQASGIKVHPLADSFTSSNLKKRITMINNSKSTLRSRFTVALIIPAAVAALVILSHSSIAATITEMSQASFLPTTEYAVPSPTISEKPLPDKPAATPEKIYEMSEVSQKPEFKDGQMGLMVFLSKNIKYPENAAKKGISGKVLVRLVVSADGKVSNPTIEKSVDPDIDNEALRVAALMPPFTPAVKDGKKVACYYLFPITFSLK